MIVDPLDATRQKRVGAHLASEDLLVPIFRNGRLVYELPNLETIRSRVCDQLDRFHGSIKRFINPHQYVVGLEQSLYDLKVRLIKKIRYEAQG